MRLCLAVGRWVQFLSFAFLIVGCASSAPSVNRPIAICDTGQENVIVFVHGVLGNADTTWRNTETDAYWPKLVCLDHDFKEFDVYAIGYDSPQMGRSSNVEEVSQRVLQQLRDRDVFTRYKQINFVAHSMGGLVVRRMLVLLNRVTDVENLRRVRTVL